MIFAIQQVTIMQEFITLGITIAVNERGILSGSPAGGSMILFSYNRSVQPCFKQDISQVILITDICCFEKWK
jgi:hypothetical protein